MHTYPLGGTCSALVYIWAIALAFGHNFIAQSRQYVECSCDFRGGGGIHKDLTLDMSTFQRDFGCWGISDNQLSY